MGHVPIRIAARAHALFNGIGDCLRKTKIYSRVEHGKKRILEFAYTRGNYGRSKNFLYVIPTFLVNFVNLVCFYKCIKLPHWLSYEHVSILICLYRSIDRFHPCLASSSAGSFPSECNFITLLIEFQLFVGDSNSNSCFWTYFSRWKRYRLVFL